MRLGVSAAEHELPANIWPRRWIICHLQCFIVCPSSIMLIPDHVSSDRKYILDQVLKMLTRNRCVIIERMFLQNNINFNASGVSRSTVEAFVTSCLNLTSLTLIGF